MRRIVVAKGPRCWRTVRRFQVLAVSFVVVASACSTSAENAVETAVTVEVTGTTPATSATATSAPVAATPGLSLDEAVAALSEESTAVEGLTAILDLLNIGIYRADGTPALPGSEDDPDDLWLLEELLPGLAAAAQVPGPTFAEFAAMLPGATEEGITATDLADAFVNMLESLPEYPMSRVLKALEVDFSPEGQLSRLESWLLLVSLAPSNQSATAAAAPTLLVMASNSLLAADVKCDEVKGDGSLSGFSLAMSFLGGANGEAESAILDQLADGAVSSTAVTTVAKTVKAIGTALGKINKLLDIAKVAQIIVNTEARVYPFTDYAHEVHDTQGETGNSNRVQLTADVVFGGVTAATELHCKFAGMLGLPAAGTPIEGAQVTVTLDEVLIAHGTWKWEGQSPVRVSTDATGRAIGWYTPKDENPDAAQELGDPFVQREEGSFTASIDVMTAMGQLFNLFAGVELAADILGIKDITVPLTVGWHDPAVHLSHVVPMTGFWTGNWALDLQTCDGTNWSGFIVSNATASVQGATMSMIGDSPISFVVPAGQSTIEVPVTVATTFSTQVEDADVTNEITQSGTIIVDLSSQGTQARIDLNLDAGTQDVLVQVPGFSLPGAGATEASSQSFTVPIQRPACEG